MHQRVVRMQDQIGEQQLWCQGTEASIVLGLIFGLPDTFACRASGHAIDDSSKVHADPVLGTIAASHNPNHKLCPLCHPLRAVGSRCSY